MGDLNLMIGVAVYINKMHSESGFELRDCLQSQMEVKELLSIEAKLIYHLHVLPSLLIKKDIAKTNAALDSALQSAPQSWKCLFAISQLGVP